MKKGFAIAALVVASIAASAPAWASGGSGGGGGGTSTGGGTASGGGTATGGGGGGGGGGTKTACTPSVTVTATASPTPGVRSIDASYVTACASKSHVTLSATNVATGVVEWSVPDMVLTTASWASPLFGTTYRIDAKVYSSTGPLLASTSTTVSTLAAPADCGPLLSISAAAGSNPLAYDIATTHNLVWCGGPANVNLTATNMATGAIEWSWFATGTTNSFPTPQFNARYRIDATAYDAYGTLAQASTEVTTGPPPPNCATITNENLSAGYWGVYAAIWVSTTAKDCGYGRTSVHMRVTNLNSGLVEYENYNLPLTSLVDFEGAITKYDTPYQIDVDVRGAGNEVLDSSSQTIVTPPFR